MRSTRARVVLDARPFSHPQPGGFKSYVRALLHGLAEAPPPEVDLLLYVDRPLPPAATASLPPGTAVRVLSPDRLRSDLLLFRRQARRDSPDLFHGTMNYAPPGLAAPHTLTIHDALGVKRYPWDRATPRTTRERLINRYWYALTVHSARRAARIVTVSGSAAGEIVAALGLAWARIAVVPNGLWLPAPAPRVARREDAVLALASPDLRKNLGALYRAMAHVPARLSLVCTSGETAERARADLARHGLAARTTLVTAPDDRRLAEEYAAATVFAWPSWWEGFGLPPLEAMRCGCPVVSSSAPAMPEVLGDAARFFDPARPEGLTEALSRALSDPALRRDLCERGRVRAAGYTCARMAEGTAGVWREALGPTAP